MRSKEEIINAIEVLKNEIESKERASVLATGQDKLDILAHVVELYKKMFVLYWVLNIYEKL